MIVRYMNISLNFADRTGVSVNHPPCCHVCNDTVAYEYSLVEKTVLCDIFKILYPVFMSPWLIWTDMKPLNELQNNKRRNNNLGIQEYTKPP